MQLTLVIVRLKIICYFKIVLLIIKTIGFRLNQSENIFSIKAEDVSDKEQCCGGKVFHHSKISL